MRSEMILVSKDDIAELRKLCENASNLLCKLNWELGSELESIDEILEDLEICEDD